MTKLNVGEESPGGGDRAPTSIAQVVTTDNHIFVIFPPGQGVIIPRRAFTDQVEMNSFANDLERCSEYGDD